MYTNKYVFLTFLLFIAKTNAEESKQTNATISTKNDTTLVTIAATEKPSQSLTSDVTISVSPSTTSPHADPSTSSTEVPTVSPTTPNASSTTIKPITSPTSPPLTPVTTTKPNGTTVIPATTTESPHHSRQFDGPSFIGGIVLATGLMAIGFVAFKFYKARTERNYHTL